MRTDDCTLSAVKISNVDEEIGLEYGSSQCRVSGKLMNLEGIWEPIVPISPDSKKIVASSGRM